MTGLEGHKVVVDQEDKPVKDKPAFDQVDKPVVDQVEDKPVDQVEDMPVDQEEDMPVVVRHKVGETTRQLTKPAVSGVLQVKGGTQEEEQKHWQEGT